jgi:DNA-binding beta-propeller fold protein YncE
MKRHRTRSRKPAALAHALRPRLEALEDRTVPATVSVAGTSLNEIGTPSAFVAPGSGGLSSPGGITLGPDGNLYVASNNGAVLRYNGTTGAYVSTFVSQGSGGLYGLSGNCLAFGPDGNLYVSSQNTNQILEYSGSTGAFVKAFVASGSGGLTNPRGLTFGPDGNLYVTSFDVNSGANGILRYQGPLAASPGSPFPATGQSGATFVAQYEPIPPVSGGFPGGGPVELVFGPDGNLYADGGYFQGVNRYDGATGAFLNSFIPWGTGGLPSGGGRGMAFDQEGRLYVGDSTDAVHRYDSQGNYLGDLLVASVNTGLAKPVGMTFDTQGRLLISSNTSNTVVRYDRGVTVSLDGPSSTPVSVSYTTADGSATAGNDYLAQSGTVTFAPGQTSRTILLATQEEAALDGNETFNVQLSNPTGGATLGTGTATVTIVDPTRQFSVADTSAVEGDHTAHYRGAFVQGTANSGASFPAFGPDGNLYVVPSSSPSAGGIDEYDGATGAFIRHFVPPGTLAGGRDMAWSNGYLYVGEEYHNDVLRFNATTGAFDRVFVTPGSGGISGSHGLTFGPDANGDGVPELYVSGRNNATVVRYDGATGAPLGTFVTSGSGGMSLPEGITFDPSGSYLYVASTGSNQILKYNAQTGAYVGVAASTGVSGPKGVKFGPDGLMYVASASNNRILRFTASGTYVDDYVPAGSGGISLLSRLAFGPDGDLYASVVGLGSDPSRIYRFGPESEALFTVSLSAPSSFPLTVSYATGSPADTAVAGRDYTSTSGTLTFAPGVTTQTIAVPLRDSGIQTAPLTFTLTLSNPEAGTLSRSQATATIAPSDQKAKFYVANDATPTLGGTNAAYKYQASGAAQAPYGLGPVDLDPRGVATTAAGTTQWVVDANKNVYVYSSAGALLGSWRAGGLNTSAQLTGIATNGTDIWLVDGYSDKVYKYTGAATRLSGSQNAASSFNLASTGNPSSRNTDPQDMVTDGTSFWVVDGIAHKVFKYTLSGSLLGSWSIDAANAHPTGIAINPASPSDIWIVDNGTDKVYQYVGAAGRTSGSQTASATFALAAGDTNPQGIADPPAPGDRIDDGRADPIRVAPAEPDQRPRSAVLPDWEPAGGRETPVAPKAPTRPAAADGWAGPAWTVGPARRKSSLYADWLAAGSDL